MIRMTFLLHALFGGVVLVSAMAPADGVSVKPAAAELTIEHAWARETPAGSTVGAAYFEIRNLGAADTLIRADTPRAKRVEFHSSRVADGMMQMRELPVVDVPRGGRVAFRPGALHAMLLDLNQPLRKGEHVSLTLVFAHAGAFSTDVVVRGLDDGDGHGR